mmetsp:Transcript_58439/g.189264  ORF Transcript_58439/g.189264 Transcript_58439/m.189264 type:complete len:135 (+) Transcript_58439:1678-2082(+)
MPVSSWSSMTPRRSQKASSSSPPPQRRPKASRTQDRRCRCTNGPSAPSAARPSAERSGKEAEKVAAVMPGGHGLPAGWSLHRRDNQVYYSHDIHGSQWSMPGASLLDGWAVHVGPCGRTYYHHEQHGSRWEMPC